jgi:NNP family nitrate/nitrite transporter-like MFS transporter
MTTTSVSGTTSTASGDTRSPWLMLVMATLGFAVNFWARALISPLGPLLRTTGSLSESDVALLVAVPVVVGVAP